MSRRKKQGGNGDATLQTLEQKVASDPHTNSFPRLPKWAYALIGTAAAAIIYVSVAAAGYFPNPLTSQQQPKPVPTAPANRNTSPTIAIDKLATIRQYQPELAEMIEQQPWFKDGIDGREKQFLDNFEKNLADPNMEYLNGVTTNNAKRVIVLYDTRLGPAKAYNFASNSVITVNPLELVVKTLTSHQSFIGIEPQWSILVVTVKKDAKRDAGAGVVNQYVVIVDMQQDESTISYSVGHEIGHAGWNPPNPKAGMPLWLSEGGAELLNYTSNGIGWLEQHVHPLLQKEYNASGLKPLAQYTLKDHTGKDAQGNDVAGRGMLFLLDYRSIAGHSAFQSTANDIYNLGMQQGDVADSDVREIMIRNAPVTAKPLVAEKFDTTVLGLTK